jgi:hypothetical protein
MATNEATPIIEKKEKLERKDQTPDTGMTSLLTRRSADQVYGHGKVLIAMLCSPLTHLQERRHATGGCRSW